MRQGEGGDLAYRRRGDDTAPDGVRLVVLVSVDEPHPIWGGVVAAPAVREIASFALTHLEIAP